ncbi:hypothetical protein ACFL6I_23870 [candidate division KSB1 bacterium]
MLRTPRLTTIDMVRETIKQHNSECSVYQLWKKLPKRMMYQTFKTILRRLEDNNEIITGENRKITYIQKERKTPSAARNDILCSLSHYGYELISIKKTKGKIIPIEDLIIQILLRFPEARFIEAIPTIIIKNRIDKFELYRKAYDYNLINKMGFLLEVSSKLKKGHMKELLDEFRKQKQDKIQYFTGIKNKSFLEKNTPKIMREWNLRGLFSMDDFRKEAYL